MKKPLIIFIIVVVVIIALLYYFLIYVPSQSIPGTSTLQEGAPCKKGLLPGVIKNGQCVVKTPTGGEIKM